MNLEEPVSLTQFLTVLNSQKKACHTYARARTAGIFRASRYFASEFIKCILNAEHFLYNASGFKLSLVLTNVML